MSRERRPVTAVAVAIAGIVVLAGCGESRSPGSAAADESVSAGTARMTELLERMAMDVDPERHRFANAAIVNALSRVEPPDDPARRLAFDAAFAEQLLNAGRFRDAITRFNAVIEALHERHIDGRAQLLPEAFELEVMDHLAATYLRLAGQENCVDGWNALGCTVPVPPGGIHADPHAAGAAAELYEAILERRPDDLGPRWLLNVARMMTGEYPQAVPRQWRVPPSAFDADYDIGRFRDVSRPMGLDMVGRVGGAIVDDFRGVGLMDVVVSSWGIRDPLRYFRNEGDGTFTDWTREAGFSGLYGGGNLIQADFTNDGYLDIFVCRGGWLEDGWPNSLLRNRGDGTFEDVTEAAGLLHPMRPSQTAAAADFDGDGWLDLTVGNESFGGRQNPLQLFRNNGDGTFTDVARDVGAAVVGIIKGVAWGDIDNDGRPDLYVSRRDTPNVLLRNDGPGHAGASETWHFSDVTDEAGVSAPIHSFPTWFFDFDNDGWLDLFVAGYRSHYGDIAAEYLGLPHRSELPRLYRNRGDGTFEDVTREARLDRILFAMGANFGDLDNDGWPDLFLGTGDAVVQALMPNRVFRNDAGVRFQDVTTSGGFGFIHKGHGVAFADIFGDGTQDIVQVFGGAYEGDLGRTVLLENPGHGNHWITFVLEGVAANRSAIGARIKVIVDTREGRREIHHVVGSGGSFGASTLRAEIGLGQALAIRAVTITWPGSGTIQEFRRLQLDRAYRIRETARAPEAFLLRRVPAPAGGQSQRPQ